MTIGTSRNAAAARTVTCPNCQSGPGQLCTQPTDTGRRPVGWVHLARHDALYDYITSMSINKEDNQP